MTNLELKRLKSELASVVAAKLNLEVRVEENLDNIQRLQEHIKIQEDKEKQLLEQLSKVNSNGVK